MIQHLPLEQSDRKYWNHCNTAASRLTSSFRHLNSTVCSTVSKAPGKSTSINIDIFHLFIWRPRLSKCASISNAGLKLDWKGSSEDVISKYFWSCSAIVSSVTFPQKRSFEEETRDWKTIGVKAQDSHPIFPSSFSSFSNLVSIHQWHQPTLLQATVTRQCNR